jgi:capsular polysaccharide biosynthesis protein
MTLRDAVMIVLRRWWVVVLLAGIAAGATAVVSRLQTPVYRATQLVLIQPSRSDFGLTEASRLLLNPMVVYLDSSQIAGRIIDDLQLPYTPQQLMARKTIAPDTLRMVIQIDVDLEDTGLAAAVAQAWGEALVEYRNQQNQAAAREDRVLAVLPDTPALQQIAPQTTLNAVAAAVLGVLLGVVAAFGIEFVESMVLRRPQDLAKLEVMVLASIPAGRE